MSKINIINIVEIWGYDELYPILQDALRVLFVSYQLLYSEKKENPYIKKKYMRLEDEITNDIVRRTIDIPKNERYRIQKQQEDFETNSKIDIAVLYSLNFGDNSNDLKIECKRLDNLDYLIDDGIIDGFKNNKYSEKLPIAGMLAYNIKDTVSENISILNTKIETKLSKKEKLYTVEIPDVNTDTYKSNHKRTSNTNIDIYTMAIDFKDVIK